MKKECRNYKAWKEKSEMANRATADKDNLCFNIDNEDKKNHGTLIRTPQFT